MNPLQNTDQPRLVKAFGVLKSNVSVNPQATIDNFYRQLNKALSEDNTLWGTWNYVKSEGKFVKALGSNDKKAIFNYPTKNSPTNNAVLTLNYVESTTRIPSQSAMMPKSLTMNIVVASKEVVSFQSSVSYNDDLSPNVLKESLKIGNFNSTLDFTSDTKNVEQKFALTYNSEVLLKFEFQTSGNYTLYDLASQVSNSSYYNEYPSIIANSGAIYVQIMNVGFYGEVRDAKKFLSKILLLIADEQYLEEQKKDSYLTEMINLMNANIIVYAYFVDKKEKIADLEFYLQEITEEYSTYEYNNVTKKYTEIRRTRTKKDVGGRLIMSDKSKQDVKIFVKSGFESLQDKLKNMNTTEE